MADPPNSPQCYPGVPDGQTGFTQNDLGNLFAFAANRTQCPDQTKTLPGADDYCHRITSLAFYPDGSPPQLCYWPAYETLTCLTLSDNTTSTSATGLITSTGGTTVTGTACNTGSCPCSTGSCFLNSVIPGDVITAGGQTVTVQTVADDGDLTVSPGFSPDVTSSAWSYKGYLISPTRDNHPAGANVQSPGGSVVITSSGGSSPVVWGLATVCTQYTGSTCTTTEATLYAYDSSLNLLWCTNSLSYCQGTSSISFKQARFALPTVVNGYVYVPTAGINTSQTANAYCTSTACSGVIVYTEH